LNTKEKREAFVQRGGKKRIKLPGTPLLTMDGEVILNYDSAEQVIADRKGIDIESTPAHTPPPQDIKPTEKKIRKFVTSERPKEDREVQKKEEDISSKPEEKKPITKEQIEEKPEIKKEKEIEQAKEPILKKDEPKEKAEEIKTETVKTPEVIENVVEESKPQPGQTPENAVPPKVQDSLFVEAESNLHKKAEQEARVVVRKPVESYIASDTAIDEKTVGLFYKTINEDITIIENIINREPIDNFNDKSLKKIIITLKIITKNPILKKLDSVKNLVEQVLKGVTFVHENMDQFKSINEVREITKEMLNYIKKENILFNSDLIVEKVNELGIKIFRLENTLNKKEEKYNSEIALIRQKIADKKILKSKHISEVLQKSGGE